MNEPRPILRATTGRSIPYGCRIGGRLPAETSRPGVEVERLIRDRTKRPRLFEADDMFVAGLSHLEPHTRRALPAVVLAFEEMIEEASLEVTRLATVERCPFAPAPRQHPLPP